MRRGLRRKKNQDGLSREIKTSRSTSIENQIKGDRLLRQSTLKLLVIEPFDGEQPIGLEAFELYKAQSIDKNLRLQYKANIRSAVYDAMRTILQEIQEGGSPILSDPKYRDHIEILEMQLTISESDPFPVEAAIAIAALWEDEIVKQIYHRCKEKIYWRASD